jgi:hypothetical protein
MAPVWGEGVEMVVKVVAMDTPGIGEEGWVIRRVIRIGGRGIMQLGVLAKEVLVVHNLGCINRRRNLL